MKSKSIVQQIGGGFHIKNFPLLGRNSWEFHVLDCFRCGLLRFRKPASFLCCEFQEDFVIIIVVVIVVGRSCCCCSLGEAPARRGGSKRNTSPTERRDGGREKNGKLSKERKVFPFLPRGSKTYYSGLIADADISSLSLFLCGVLSPSNPERVP